MKNSKELAQLLEQNFQRFHRPDFIKDDPISIPRYFTKKQDVEIAGFFAATIAWGNRKSIIRSAKRLMELMEEAPYDFILHHEEVDLKRFERFVHRTFQPTDLLYFIYRLKKHYTANESLETMFSDGMSDDDPHSGPGLIHFHNSFFNDKNAPNRTRKHVSTPAKNSACKRLNMYLRWMVRSADGGVDFGLWNHIKPSQLLLPLDVHVQRVSMKLGLLQRRQSDWKACIELWENVRKYDSEDPAKFDFSLFGLGVLGD